MIPRHRQHSDMHPLTKARVDAGAQVGRALSEYGEACALHEIGMGTDKLVDFKRAEFNIKLDKLVEAAQREGAELL
jgi:hypothetical protein